MGRVLVAQPGPRRCLCCSPPPSPSGLGFPARRQVRGAHSLDLLPSITVEPASRSPVPSPDAAGTCCLPNALGSGLTSCLHSLRSEGRWHSQPAFLIKAQSSEQVPGGRAEHRSGFLASGYSHLWARGTEGPAQTPVPATSRARVSGTHCPPLNGLCQAESQCPSWGTAMGPTSSWSDQHLCRGRPLQRALSLQPRAGPRGRCLRSRPLCFSKRSLSQAQGPDSCVQLASSRTSIQVLGQAGPRGPTALVMSFPAAGPAPALAAL